MSVTVNGMLDSISRYGVLNATDHARIAARWRKPGRHDADDPKALARWLVINKMATPYQTELLLSNRESDLAIDQYQIVDKVQIGAANGCLEATDALGRTVMLQFVGQPHAPGDHAVARTKAQAKAATKAVEPHVWRVLDHGMVDGRFYLVREAIRGETLAALLAQDKSATPVTLARFLAKSLGGLADLHQQGISVGPISADLVAIVKGSGSTRTLKLLYQPIVKDGPIASPEAETLALCQVMHRLMADHDTDNNEYRPLRPLSETLSDIPEVLATVMDTLVDTDASVRPRNAAMAAKSLRIALASLEETEKPQALDETETIPVPASRVPDEEPDPEDDSMSWARPWLDRAGVTVREAACVAAGALGMILLLLAALFVVGDLVPILALGLGAAGGVWIERWIRKQLKN